MAMLAGVGLAMLLVVDGGVRVSAVVGAGLAVVK